MTSDLSVRLGSCVLSVFRGNVVALSSRDAFSSDEFDMMFQLYRRFVGSTVLDDLPDMVTMEKALTGLSSPSALSIMSFVVELSS